MGNVCVTMFDVIYSIKSLAEFIGGLLENLHNNVNLYF